MKIVKELLSYILIIAVVVLIRTFWFTPALVDGESMEPTLYSKELIIINKLDLRTKGIQRWDIVVVDFTSYNHKSEYLLKRVIGLPGDHVQYIDNVLYINGEQIQTPIEFEETDDYEASVPKNSYLVMGDNRDVSYDSRHIGSINKKNIKGIAKFVLYPFNRIQKIK